MTDLSNVKTTLEQLKADIKTPREGEEGTTPGAGSLAAVSAVTELVNEAIALFAEFGSTFTPADRERLIGAGIKNFGFIQTAYAHAAANSAFVPPYLDMAEFSEAVRNVEAKRVLAALLDQFSKTVSDSMLADNDSAFHDALDFYHSVRQAAKNRVPGAEVEFNVLKPYFKRGKSAHSADEPTEAQIERDLRGLLHGTKEGKIVVENENPQAARGTRTVVDTARPDDGV
jgi:hypothetical protein